jgi:hypothetical protein
LLKFAHRPWPFFDNIIKVLFPGFNVKIGCVNLLRLIIKGLFKILLKIFLNELLIKVKILKNPKTIKYPELVLENLVVVLIFISLYQFPNI